jgi:hypothetical protein
MRQLVSDFAHEGKSNRRGHRGTRFPRRTDWLSSAAATRYSTRRHQDVDYIAALARFLRRFI